MASRNRYFLVTQQRQLLEPTLETKYGFIQGKKFETESSLKRWKTGTALSSVFKENVFFPPQATRQISK